VLLKKLLKYVAWTLFLATAFPAGVLCAFGRIRSVYSAFAHAFALFPGLPGDYLRIAFYKLTLTECSLLARISFGSFFAHPEARIARGVYIGSYCILGRTAIGEHTHIASAVQILSGKRQHIRDQEGKLSGSEHGEFNAVTIGADCWIGAAAIVMADVGLGSTIGAASVVTRPIPANSTAVGSPARVIKAAGPSPDDGVSRE
jgi:acetyltransferase-like isoleucine patch superfamily enzyme